MTATNRSYISLVLGIVLTVSGATLYVRTFHLHTVYRCADTLRGALAAAVRPLRGDEGRLPAARARHRYEKAGAGFVHSGRFLFYVAPRDTTLGAVAREAIGHTMFYSHDRFREALKSVNGVKDGAVPKGAALFIPASLPPYVKEQRNARMPALIRAKGIYFTGHSIGRDSIFPVIEKYRKAGINTVVFDAKDITGTVNYRSEVPLAVKYDTHDKAPIGNIDHLIRFLKERNIYTVVRIALFRDHLLHKRARELAIRTHDGRLWEADSGELWVDPTNRDVQDYCIGLAEELAGKGVDEIQFDYIRFPTNGSLSRAALAHHRGRMTNEEAITDFLKRAHERIAAKNVRLSIDIFGIVAWGKEVDIRRTGQRIELLAKHCDVISPMLYPSHFEDDFDGFARPGDNPYHFIYNGCRKVAALAGGTAIRPWLQAFRWRVSSYDERYIKEQVRASDDSGALGYLFWNASNNYDVVYRTLAVSGTKVATGGDPKKSDAAARDGKRPVRKKKNGAPHAGADVTVAE